MGDRVLRSINEITAVCDRMIPDYVQAYGYVPMGEYRACRARTLEIEVEALQAEVQTLRAAQAEAQKLRVELLFSTLSDYRDVTVQAYEGWQHTAARVGGAVQAFVDQIRK